MSEGTTPADAPTAAKMRGILRRHANLPGDEAQAVLDLLASDLPHIRPHVVAWLVDAGILAPAHDIAAWFPTIAPTFRVVAAAPEPPQREPWPDSLPPKRPMSDFMADHTEIIREWVGMNPVDAADLVVELRFWLDYLGAGAAPEPQPTKETKP